MSTTRRVLGVAAGAAGLAAGATVWRVAQRRRIIARRGVGDVTPFGSLRADPLTVVADDGVPLHVEVDELDPEAVGGKGARARQRHTELTVVFVHGYALNMDSWHFQRAAYRGLVRTVYYDQRSHGRSGRSDRGAREHRAARPRPAARPRRGRARGAGRAGRPLDGRHDDRRAGRGAPRAVRRPRRRRRADRDHRRRHRPAPRRRPAAALHRSGASSPAGWWPRSRAGRAPSTGSASSAASVALVATDELAFGDAVPARYVEFVDDMLSATPFGVVADFFPTFGTLDKFETVHAMSEVPVADRVRHPTTASRRSSTAASCTS